MGRSDNSEADRRERGEDRSVMSSLEPSENTKVIHPGIKSSCDPKVLGQYADYELLKRIGQGGVSDVYLARKVPSHDEGNAHESDPVALKIPRADRMGQPTSIRLLVREGKRLLDLNHPHILPILDFSENPDLPYVATPYQSRGSMAAVIRQQGLPNRETLRHWMRGVLLALIELHDECELHHRDLKPENILISNTGESLLADFGLVKRLEYDSLALDGKKHLMGTIPYLAPEVAANHGASALSEIYAFGACLYEALTGWPPYCQPGSPASVDKILAGDLVPIQKQNPEADPDLTAIAERCMARTKEDRYISMVQLLTNFDKRTQTWIAESTDKAQEQDKLETLNRKRFRIGVFCILLIGILVGTRGFGWYDPELILVETFALDPAFPPGNRRHLTEWNADPDPEFVTVTTNGFAAISASGTLIPPNLIKPSEWSSRLTIAGFSDYDQDGIDEVIFGLAHKENIVVSIRNRNNIELRRFETKGAYEDIGNPMIEDHNTRVRYAEVVDLDNDGDLEMLFILHTGVMREPRALVCFDNTTREELWRFATGPQLTPFTISDIDADGDKEVLVPGAAVDNGIEGPDGLSDSNSYLFAINHQGEMLWKLKTGNAHTFPGVRTLDIDGDGKQEILATVVAVDRPIWQNGQVNETKGRSKLHLSELSIVDTNGNVVTSRGMKNSLRSVKTGDLDGDGKHEVLVATMSGQVNMYGEMLALEQNTDVQQLYKGDAPDYNRSVYLDDVVDLNGDGSMELVARVVEEVTHHKNTTSDHRSPPTQSTFHFPRIVIFNHKLRVEGNYLIATKWSEGYQMITTTRPTELRGHRKIFLLADKIYQFDYR